MEEVTGFVAGLEQVELAVGSLSDNTGTLVTIGTAVSAWIGASKRAGGARFVALTETVGHAGRVLQRAAGIVRKIGDVVEELGAALVDIYQGIKAQQEAQPKG